jgi:sialic acid synthase SpsE
MHCTLSYPTRPEDANLSAVRDIRKAFPRHVLGFSDHTLGPYIGAGSVLFGVDVIEKHFTVDRSLPGSADHWLSSDENELRLLRSMADEFRKARGSGRKTVLESEKAARANARRSLVARGPIPKGATFTPDNVIAKRPASGLSPMYFDSLVGLTTVKDLPDDAVIQAVDVAEDAPFKQITESTASEFRPKQ